MVADLADFISTWPSRQDLITAADRGDPGRDRHPGPGRRAPLRPAGRPDRRARHPARRVCGGHRQRRVQRDRDPVPRRPAGAVHGPRQPPDHGLAQPPGPEPLPRPVHPVPGGSGPLVRRLHPRPDRAGPGDVRPGHGRGPGGPGLRRDGVHLRGRGRVRAADVHPHDRSAARARPAHLHRLPDQRELAGGACRVRRADRCPGPAGELDPAEDDAGAARPAPHPPVPRPAGRRPAGRPVGRAVRRADPGRDRDPGEPLARHLQPGRRRGGRHGGGRAPARSGQGGGGEWREGAEAGEKRRRAPKPEASRTQIPRRRPARERWAARYRTPTPPSPERAPGPPDRRPPRGPR